MNQFVKLVFIALFFALSPAAQAQWFYEMGLSRNTFESYDIDNTNTAVFNSEFIPYKGLRDLSFNVGYLFSLSSQNKEAVDYRPAFLRLGVGLGFDQINIRTNVRINNLAYPTNYNLAQLKARLGIHLTPVVFYGNSYGARKPTAAITLHGGGAFNQFTSAIRQGADTSVDLINDSNEFNETYFSYFYGAGMEFYLNKTASIYARYSIENSEDLVETGAGTNTKESYKIHKNRFSLGLTIDLKLINRMKKNQQDKIKALEDKLAENSSLRSELQDIAAENAKLGNDLDAVKDELAKLQSKMIDESSMKTKLHETGVRYFPDFKEIKFKLNSSHFDTKHYAPVLAKVALFMEQNPKLKIRIDGYADMRGTHKYNMRISKKRAERVRDYLIKNSKISPDRFMAVGKGQTDRFSLSQNSSNRRAEFIIIE